MGRRVITLVVLAGCHQQTDLAGDAGGDDGATTETGVDVPTDPSCFGTGFEHVCLVALPTTPLTIGTDTALDTDASPVARPPRRRPCRSACWPAPRSP
jgi:hypothetical protein